MMGASELLKSGGLLVISVPDVSSLRARRLKEKWEGFQPHAHLTHFSKKALSNLLWQTGYKIIGISSWGGTGLMKKWKDRTGKKGGLRNFLIKYNFLRKIINFTYVKLFRAYHTITVYAHKT